MIKIEFEYIASVERYQFDCFFRFVVHVVALIVLFLLHKLHIALISDTEIVYFSESQGVMTVLPVSAAR